MATASSVESGCCLPKGWPNGAIALTAHAGAHDLAKVMSAGFQRHVPKPLQPRELVTAIATLTKSKSEKECSKGIDAQKALILIVDDFKDDREMYAHYLSRSGFRVSLASDGQEALDKALQLLPDLILMDLWLPQIGGWEAIRQLKASEKTKHIPIVVFTARAFVSATAVGSEGCLIKPCQPDDFLVEVVRVLEKHKKINGTAPPSGTSLLNGGDGGAFLY